MNLKDVMQKVNAKESRRRINNKNISRLSLIKTEDKRTHEGHYSELLGEAISNIDTRPFSSNISNK